MSNTSPTEIDELDKIFAKLNGYRAHASSCPRSADSGCRCALRDEYLREAKVAIQAHTAQAVQQARIDELHGIVRNANIELMDPKKPFTWGVDTWTRNVPVIPRMLIDDRIASLSNTKEPES